MLARQTRAGQTISFTYDTLNPARDQDAAGARAGGDVRLRSRRTSDELCGILGDEVIRRRGLPALG